MSTVPGTTLSVVVASIAGAPFVDACLRSLWPQAGTPGVEVIVVVRGSGSDAARVAREFPWACVLHADGAEGVPQLRLRGVHAARGDLVGVIEEHCVAAPDWVARVLEAHASGTWTAAGGPIADDGYRRLRDWAVYYLEYSDALPPWQAGAVRGLNGANIAYRRRALLQHESRLSEGYWEATLHPELVAGDERMLSAPHMIVRKCGPFPFGEYLHQRYCFSRAFAGARAPHLSAVRRAVYLAATPLLPVVLLARMTRRIWRTPAHRTRFALTLPLLLPALAVYAAGECIGYVRGPGDALSKVR